MASITGKWDLPQYDSKYNFVIEMLRHNYPGLQVSVRVNGLPGDYTEFLIEGVTTYKVANTVMATISPQELYHILEKQIKYQPPKRDAVGKLNKIKDESWADKWAREHKEEL